MPKNMSHLAFRQPDSGQPDHPIRLLIAGRKGSAFTGDQFLIERAGEGDGTVHFPFCIDEGEFVSGDLRAFNFGGLVPACAGRKTEFNDQR